MSFQTAIYSVFRQWESHSKCCRFSIRKDQYPGQLQFSVMQKYCFCDSFIFQSRISSAVGLLLFFKKFQQFRVILIFQ